MAEVIVTIDAPNYTVEDENYDDEVYLEATEKLTEAIHSFHSAGGRLDDLASLIESAVGDC